MTTHYPVNILSHDNADSFPPTINVGGKLLLLDKPLIMGIVNATPDSFHAASRCQNSEQVAARTRQMIDEGADVIDIGACSTRPGSIPPSQAEEWERLKIALAAIRRVLDSGKSDVLVSVDTYRAEVAQRAVEEYGIDIINDISGGTLDADMFTTVAKLNIPYVLTHIQGTPTNMQDAPHYNNVTVEVTQWLAERIDELHQMGVADVIIDPGFGFGKTKEQCRELLDNLSHLRHELPDNPLLVGMSRKRFVNNSLEETLQAQCMALRAGAHIVRVHDVAAMKKAMQHLS